MLKRILVLVFIAIPTIVLAQAEQKTPTTKPDVYLIGVIHSRHFNPKYSYSITDLLNQVLALKPDLVCGEITPEAFNNPMEGYYPPEAAFLAEMASECSYRFEPVDWRLDYTTQTKANSEYPQKIKVKRDSLVKQLNDDLENSDAESIYDFIHDTVTLASLDSLYEKIVCTNVLSEIAQGSWNERNRRIVENGMTAAKDAQTIVFVFGVDHLPQLQRYLKAIGIEAKIPERMFTPDTNYKVSMDVLIRWMRNLGNLTSIRDKKVEVSYDDYKKVLSSNRIQDLEEAIQVSK